MIDLLDGPRGRRLALEVATMLATPDLKRAIDCGNSTGPGTLDEAQIAIGLAGMPLDGLTANLIDEALQSAVSNARYWQEPDEADELAARDSIRHVLRRIADSVLAHPTARWWSESMDAEQWQIQFDDVPRLQGTLRERLEDWHAEEVDLLDRYRTDRRISAHWWSVPAMYIQRSVRAHHSHRFCDGGPVGLWLTEDDLGWQTADCRPLETAGPVLEIRGPQDWIDLCSAHPLEVLRRNDWGSATDIDSRWVIPDWRSVATTCAGVHLPVSSWLTIAGRALRVDDDIHTLIGGWHPDETIWLVDLPESQDAQIWVADDDLHWARR